MTFVTAKDITAEIKKGHCHQKKCHKCVFKNIINVFGTFSPNIILCVRFMVFSNRFVGTFATSLLRHWAFWSAEDIRLKWSTCRRIRRLRGPVWTAVTTENRAQNLDAKLDANSNLSFEKTSCFSFPKFLAHNFHTAHFLEPPVFQRGGDKKTGLVNCKRVEWQLTSEALWPTETKQWTYRGKKKP